MISESTTTGHIDAGFITGYPLPFEDDTILKPHSIEKIKQSQRRNQLRAFNNKRIKLRERYFGDLEGILPYVDKLQHEEAKLRLKSKLRRFGNNTDKFSVLNLNTINYGNPQSLKHYVAKAVLGYILINNSLHFSTEILDGDLWLIEYDYLIELEKNYVPSTIESKINKFKKRFNDMLILNLNDIPGNIEEMREYFFKKLGL